MTERWVPVVGWEDTHEVSSLGRVRRRDGFIYKTPGDSHGYPVMNLRRNGKSATHRVHVMMLKAFRGPPQVGQESLHINDIPDDNRIENLRWGSRSENALDVVANGNHHNAKRETCGKCGRPYDGVAKTKGRRPFRFCRACHNAVMKAQRQNRPCRGCGGPREEVGHRKDGTTYNFCRECYGRPKKAVPHV